jgi:hypothetical protein
VLSLDTCSKIQGDKTTKVRSTQKNRTERWGNKMKMTGLTGRNLIGTGLYLLLVRVRR